MDRGLEFWLIRYGSFLIVDILNKNLCELIGNFFVLICLLEMNFEMVINFEKYVVKVVDKLDFEDNFV